MGRVNRLMERRALRRAADQALLTSLGNPVEAAGGAPDQDFTYTHAERERPQPVAETPAPAYDHDPVTAPIPVFDVEESVLPQSVPPWEYASLEDEAEPADVYDLVGDQPADAEPDRNIAAPVATAAAVTEPPQDYAYRWVERDDDVDEVNGVVAPPAPPLRARPAAETAYVRPELDFAKSGYGTQQWYRTKPAAAVLAAALIAAVVCGGWLVFRSPGTTAQESQTNTPTSAAPAPSNAAPTAVSAPNQPKPAPPPPPPPASTIG